MNAAAPHGAQSKNPYGFFSSQSSLMRRLTPRGGSVNVSIFFKIHSFVKKTFLPRCASKTFTVFTHLIPREFDERDFPNLSASLLQNEAPRRGPDAGSHRIMMNCLEPEIFPYVN
jgi:hypothetical protein